MPAGFYVLRIDAVDLVPRFSGPLHIAAGGKVPTLEVDLLTGGTIEGRVVDDQEQPVVGAEVCTDADVGFRDEGEDPEPLQRPFWDGTGRVAARTDARGWFRLAHVPPGNCQLRVGTGQHCLRLVRRVHVVDDGWAPVGDVVLQRGTRVYGMVRDGEARPLPGAFLQLWPANCRPGQDRGQDTFFASTFSDEQVAYEFAQAIPAGRYVLPTARDGPSFRVSFGRRWIAELQFAVGRDACRHDVVVSP